MQVEIYENFKFSYIKGEKFMDGIKHCVTGILVFYEGNIIPTVFKELVKTSIDGELSNLIFTTEDYEHIDKLEELDNLGIINVAVVDEIDTDFNFIIDSVEAEITRYFSDGDDDVLKIILFNTH